jgi:hypothetical protein
VTEPTDDPTDETQPHDTPGMIVPPPGPASAGAIPVPGPGPLAGDAGAGTVPEPDETDAAASLGVRPPVAPAPPLRADPDRPVSDWREPPWFPPDRPQHRDRGPSVASIVVGLFLVAIGLWYFLDQTLGIQMPEIRWGSLWPVLLILLGLVIVGQAARRR